MLFTDTYSLMYWLETADINMQRIAERVHIEFELLDKGSQFFASPETN